VTSNEITIRVSAKDTTTAGLAQAEARAKASGENIVNTLASAGDRAGEQFTRRLDGKLRNSRGQFAKAGQESGEGFKDGLGSGLGGGGGGLFGGFFARLLAGVSDMASSAGKSLSSLFPALAGFASTTAATGGLNLLVGALLALAAAAAASVAVMVTLAPVVLLVGGAFGAANTLLVGLVGTFAVFSLGLGGLSDAWDAFGMASSGGGRSAAAAAHQTALAQREVKNATEALADAQRAAAAAQLAVTQARADETERLEDLSRNLASAQRGEEGAVIALARAEERLREVRRTRGHTALDMREAELAVRDAQAAIEDMHDRVGDLTKEQADGAKKGVEGSDQVQAALERQRQAQKDIEQATLRLADAQYALRDGMAASAGGVDKFAQAMAKLSPNGRALINTLIALKPQFDELKKSVQDRFLDGINLSFKDLATRWLPVLGPVLGSLAGKFNSLLKTIFTAAGRPQFIADIVEGMAGFGQFVERIGKSLDPMIGAFGKLSRASLPFLGELGDMIGGLVEKFSKWIESADKSGALTQFMKDAAQALRDIWDIGGLTIAVLGDFVEILFPQSKSNSTTFLAGVKAVLDDLHEWLADPTNQEKVRDWIEKIEGFVDKVATEWIPAALDWAEKINGWVKTVDGWIKKVEGWADAIGKTKDRIKANAHGLFDPIKAAFKEALNWVIDRWNGLHFTLPSASFFGTQIGGGSIGVSPIQRFAHGGIAGGLVEMNERGREFVKLPNGSMVIPNGTTEAMLSGASGGGSSTVTLIIDVRNATAEAAAFIRKMVSVEGGGSVQIAFGKAAR